jgi:polysaccharide deacetylase family protein (PEP-CTERM system associated)
MNILTFDVEEWFHILDHEATRSKAQWAGFEGRIQGNLDRLLCLLQDKEQKATLFCLGWVARQYPQVVKQIDSLGYQIGTHSDMHQLVYMQKRDDFKRDLERSIKTLEDLTGKRVTVYRAPGFSITRHTPWAFDTLADCGIEIDCSIFPSSRAHGGYKEFPFHRPCFIEREGIRIKEFPASYYRVLGRKVVFSGGGYFRITPYSLIRHMMRRSDYIMVYLHCRDFDRGQAIIGDLSLLRRFKSYVGIKGAFRKLKAMLSDFPFVDLRTADSLIDWDSARTISI